MVGTGRAGGKGVLRNLDAFPEPHSSIQHLCSTHNQAHSEDLSAANQYSLRSFFCDRLLYKDATRHGLFANTVAHHLPGFFCLLPDLEDVLSDLRISRFTDFIIFNTVSLEKLRNAEISESCCVCLCVDVFVHVCE